LTQAPYLKLTLDYFCSGCAAPISFLSISDYIKRDSLFVRKFNFTESIQTTDLWMFLMKRTLFPIMDMTLWVS
jgi:hypothetical protein